MATVCKLQLSRAQGLREMDVVIRKIKRQKTLLEPAEYTDLFKLTCVDIAVQIWQYIRDSPDPTSLIPLKSP